MKLMKWKLLLIAAAGFAFSGTANAQATQNINVTATVPSVCVFDAATTGTTMAFDLSTLATAAADFEATTTLAWRCSAGSNAFINIGPGGSTDQTAREMSGAGGTLAYNLFTEDTYTNIWGNGAGGTVTSNITGLGMNTVGNSIVYGRVLLANAQAANVGAYTDTVLVTFTF
jgi:spore coat protein U-like protein